MSAVSTSGPRIPGNVEHEAEDEADLESAADAEVTMSPLEGSASLSGQVPHLHLQLAGVQRDVPVQSVRAGVAAPPPKVLAPPPKIRPPQWLAPGPPPAEDDDYIPEAVSPVGSESSTGEGLDIRKSKLEEFLAVQIGMQRNCHSLPVTCVLWLSFIVLIFHHGQAFTSFQVASVIEDAVLNVRAPAVHRPDGTGGNLQELQIGRISELDEILRWTETGLVRMLQTNESAGSLASGSQQVISFLRMEQTRGGNSSSCPHLTSTLSKFHTGGCHRPDGEPVQYGVNVTSTDNSFTPIGNVFTAWAEMGRSEETIALRFKVLRDSGWLDLHTQTVTLSIMFLAPKPYVFSMLIVKFELTREGMMKQKVFVRPVRGDLYGSWLNALFDLVWAVTLVILGITLVADAVKACVNGAARTYFLNPSTWLDWICLIGGLALAIFFLLLSWELVKLEDSVVSIGSSLPPFATSEAPQTRTMEMMLANFAYQKRMVDLLDHFNLLATVTMYQRLCSFVFALALIGRFCRGLSGQPRIAVLIQSLLLTADYLLHFLIPFCFTFFSFCLSGYILFGGHLLGWSTMGRSINSLLLVLFGRFDYMELNEVAPWLAAFWFWGLYIILAMLLLNILLASVVHRYVDVQSRLGEPGVGIVEHIGQLIQAMRFRNTYEGSQKSVPYEALLSSLNEDMDDARISRAGRLNVDRRVRTRNDLGTEEKDPRVTVEDLIERGCDASSAAHLLDRCNQWRNSISMSKAPEHRLLVHVARHMERTNQEAGLLRERMRARVNHAAIVLDRIDLKNAKSYAVARRVKAAQQLPIGWTVQYDEYGRRYLRHEESGLTSWTLPRSVVQ
eukprot:TRINITY_DN37819_c0_g1_i1.p1 TRINITY_DN37819_c0_g1~~TRINITY_DN37819_c0_g1_i1.p1  ORF type:complete len:841 (+),score=98.81 TRINITY_DN37819_c0_g1_i1:82-2604(+)